METLNLEYNSINNLCSNCFTGYYPSKLNRLDLKENDITNIETNSFDGLHSLTELNLVANQMHQNYEDNVLDLKYLKNLNIKSNSLNNLTKIFDNLNNIEILDLNNNYIDNIDKNIFSNNKRIISLQMIGNNLVEFNVDLFKTPYINNLDLSNNNIVG